MGTLTPAPPLRRRTRRPPCRRESPPDRCVKDAAAELQLEAAKRPRERPPPTPTSTVDAMDSACAGAGLPSVGEARQDEADDGGGDKRTLLATGPRFGI